MTAKAAPGYIRFLDRANISAGRTCVADHLLSNTGLKCMSIAVVPAKVYEEKSAVS